MKNKYIFNMSESTADTLAHLILLSASAIVFVGLYAGISYLS